MMDSTCIPQSFSRRLRILQIPLILMLPLTYQLVVTDTSKQPILLSGEIGGEVTFPCLVTNQRSASALYVQKGNIFVNGFYVSKPLQTPKWENTRLDQDKNVHMYQLNASHVGKYTCHIQYNDNSFEEIEIFLNVTASYSKPNVSVSCSYADHTCKVTCASYGGYPKNKMSWDLHTLGNVNAEMRRVVENPPECDKKTELCNISSTATFNCSIGLHRNLSCYVDDPEIFSMFSICDIKPLPTTTPDSPVVLVAVGAVVVLAILGMLLLLLWWWKKGQRGHRNQRRRQESNVEEGHALKE